MLPVVAHDQELPKGAPDETGACPFRQYAISVNPGLPSLNNRHAFFPDHEVG